MQMKRVVRVSGRTADGTAVSLRIWADAHQPVVHVEGTAAKPVSVTATLELDDNWKMTLSGLPTTASSGAAASHGPGKIVACEWDFGDGVTAREPVATHTYDKAGTYAVFLRMKGVEGRTNFLDGGIAFRPRKSYHEAVFRSEVARRAWMSLPGEPRVAGCVESEGGMRRQTGTISWRE